jgi:hypothetical protein
MRQILAFAMALLASCVNTSQVAPTLAGPTRFSTGDSFYVSVPRDGEFEGHTYAGSGVQTAHAVESELLRHATTVKVGSAVEDREAAQKTAQGGKLLFLVVPTILHWEDRATEWSGRPDRLEVRIDVVNAADGTMLHSAVLSGKSKWATFGGDHPQGLLPKPLEEYFATLFNTPIKPAPAAHIETSE